MQTAAVSGPAAVNFAENDEEAVATYTATGIAEESIAWSVSGDDGAEFEIAGGVLAFLTVPDYEKPSDTGADNVYEVTVTASDASPASASINATVTVADVNDPSVVVIMADDAGYEVFGAYGSTQYSTPRLDAIAASGVRFDNAFSKPLCTPSRVAIMTGQSNVRNYSNFFTMQPGQYTFADLFSDAGYATAITGKWQLQGRTGSTVEGVSAGRGFDTYCLWHTALTDGESNSRYWNPSVECDGSLVETDSSDFGPDIFVEFLLDFIETNQRQPFFAYYPMVLPHDPFVLPPGAECDEDCGTQEKFEKMVTRVDRNVGLIYDKLETLGLLDNTLLLFIADNGTHKRIISSLGGEVLYGDKALPTDGGTRVPLIAHVPGQTQGRVISDLVDITDIFPTVADAAGIEVPSDHTVDGVSFWEQLQGNAGSPREWIYTYYFPNPEVPRFELPKWHPEIAYARDKQYKLYSTGEMFDLTADRLELRPLPADDADSATARTTLQAVLDSMPARGEGISSGLTGIVPDGLRRPRWRPVLSGAAVTHDKLTLSYVGWATTPEPPAQSFTVLVDGTEVAISGTHMSRIDVASSGVTSGTTTVTLTLESEVVAGQDVTVSYVPVADNAILHINRNRGPANQNVGHHAAPLSGVSVVNLTPPNDPPAVSGPAAVDFVEGGSGSVAVFSASDPQGDEVSWSLSGTDAGRFSLGDDGTLSFTGTPDFESPADGDSNNVYEVAVVASDGRLSAMVGVSVTVTDVNEAPAVSGPPSANYDENSVTGVADYDATDPENDTLVWSLAGADAGHFEVGAGGVLSFAEPPDFEARADTGANNVYNVTVRATDRDLSDPEGLQDEVAVAVTVRNVDETPSLSGPPSANFDENDTGDVATYRATDPDGHMIVWSLAGPDRDVFTVAGGVLEFDSPPDFEDPDDTGGDNDYDVTVVASDGDRTSELAVTVTVGNVDEPGVVGLSSQPQAGTELTATLSDPDGSVSNVSWSWQRSQNRSSWSEISGATARRYTPSDNDVDLYLRASVSYDDGEGAAKSAEQASDARTRAEPPTNTAPEFSGGDAQRTVAENSPAGTAVGAPVAASDPDAGDTLIYTLTGGEGLFTIDRASGQVRVDGGAVLNHEEQDSYQVTVTATDASTASDSVLVDITVTDVDEPPEAADDRATLSEDTAARIDVLANDTDPDGEALSVVLRDRPDDGTAAVEADKTVTYTPDADYHGIDTFTYRASDGRHFDEATVTVTVEPVNDAPAFGSSGGAERTVAAGAAAGTPVGAPVAAEDPDGDVLTYTLGGTGAALFDIDQYSAQVTVSADAALDAAAATHRVTVTAADPANATASIEVTITATSNNGGGGVGGGGAGGAGGGGGGGGAPGPEPEPGEETTPPRDYFVDDDGSVHEANINKIAAAGITVGCNPPAGDRSVGNRYCLTESVTRAQMATFLARALDLPDTGTDYFVDDDGSVHEANINKIAAAGITVGCNPPAGDRSVGNRYCLTESVTRAQMATFLARALDLPDTGTDYFVDDDGSVHEANINKIAAAGITVGCNPPAGDRSVGNRYCLTESVTRAQMATFLARALEAVGS